MNTTRKIGIALILVGIAIYFLIPQVYGWIPGAMLGSGLGLALFFGPREVKESSKENT